uniref:Saposin B-type domain-containing protein n=1 Tax=Panagrellus redivivus TaxID=6233 RepID=A0A7E4ZUR8_PANRE
MKVNYIFLFTLLIAFTIATANSIPEPQTRGMMCTWCETFVKDLEVELNKNEGTVEQAAERACDKACKNHPTMDVICKKVIEFSLDPLIKAMENHETPKVACRQIDLC